MPNHRSDMRDRGPQPQRRPGPQAGGASTTHQSSESTTRENTPFCMAPSDTRQSLRVVPNQNEIPYVESRSLILNRLANPELKDDHRRKFFKESIMKVDRASAEIIRKSRLELIRHRSNGSLLEMELRARMVVNASGGVMENAGLCLDRFSNLPYIPGSAVKGCARRTAVYFAREWVEVGKKPSEILNDQDLNYGSPDELFVDLALIFGWVDQDWAVARDENDAKSDFEWIWGEKWREKRNSLAVTLLKRLGREADSGNPPVGQLPNFEGLVCFTEGWPQHSPSYDLELDVVTCHHRNYYEGKEGFENAPDIEDPKPVVFPVVAPGHRFLFGIYPIHRPVPGSIRPDELARKARAWLKLGLQIFGIGAKTAAGYGWFADSSYQDNAASPEARASVTALDSSKPPSGRQGDFNENEIKNLIRQALSGPGQWNDTLKKRVQSLSEPQNAIWKKKFIEETKASKELRKQSWYPT